MSEEDDTRLILENQTTIMLALEFLITGLFKENLMRELKLSTLTGMIDRTGLWLDNNQRAESQGEKDINE